MPPDRWPAYVKAIRDTLILAGQTVLIFCALTIVVAFTYRIVLSLAL